MFDLYTYFRYLCIQGRLTFSQVERIVNENCLRRPDLRPSVPFLITWNVRVNKVKHPELSELPRDKGCEWQILWYNWGHLIMPLTARLSPLAEFHCRNLPKVSSKIEFFKKSTTVENIEGFGNDWPQALGEGMHFLWDTETSSSHKEAGEVMRNTKAGWNTEI